MSPANFKSVQNYSLTVLKELNKNGQQFPKMSNKAGILSSLYYLKI